MTKRELIEKLQSNKLPDDTLVLVSVKKYNGGEATWDEVDDVDTSSEPILIHLGETVMY